MPDKFFLLKSERNQLLDTLFDYMIYRKLPTDFEFCYDSESSTFFNKNSCSKFLSANDMFKNIKNTQSKSLNNALQALSDKFQSDFLKKLEDNTPNIEDWGTDINIDPPSLGVTGRGTAANVINVKDLIKELNYYLKNKKLSSNVLFMKKIKTFLKYFHLTYQKEY